MKKLIVILVIVCLAFVGALTYFTWDRASGSVEEPVQDAAEATPAAEETAAPFTAGTVNIEKLYASHEPDEVVFTVNGAEVTWSEFFGWLNLQIQQNQYSLTTMNSYYGMNMDWSDPVSEDGATVAKYTVDAAVDTVRQNYSIADFCRSNGTELDAEAAEIIESRRQQDIAAICGEDGTEEDFEEYLASIYMTSGSYNTLAELDALYQLTYKGMYGKDSELVTDEQALGYLADNSYLHTNHILLATMDTSTGEAVDEATAAAKLETAQKLSDELKAIADTDALLKRFSELKAENCDDPGKTSYPEGMTYQTGSMVEPFETAANAMEDYGVSDPIETDYGYFVIIRLPMDADELIYSSADSTAQNARMKYANDAFGKLIQAHLETVTVEYAPDFADFSIMPFVEHTEEG